MRIQSPARHRTFSVGPDARWPEMVFETDAQGGHHWRWNVTWRTFSRHGQAATPGPRWDAREALSDLGGTLNVRAFAGGQSAGTQVRIAGENPGEARVQAYLACHRDGATMLRLVAQESRFRHFRSDGQPVRSFDGGYGLVQLTNPRPGYEQVWNWQRNLDAGLRLYARKRDEAAAYLGQGGRSFSDAQLERETVSRWNGGHYHVWDAAGGRWTRRADVLCDSRTGNIGWNLSDPDNQGKTEAELRRRDAGGYNARSSASKWRYFGACYADHVLG